MLTGIDCIVITAAKAKTTFIGRQVQVGQIQFQAKIQLQGLA